ncbi:MAG: methionine biosynthesis protein MetW [Candidatus Methanomethylicaceae archaeon]
MRDQKRPLKIYSRKDKYTIVADLLRGEKGVLLDVGARDRTLGRLLASQGLIYYSADLGPGYDYQLNLEEKLPLADRSFDYVVALDVLEHIEHIHLAFQELARITRKCLIIALPNMAALPRRWSFLWRGNLGTGKYALLTEHQGDRHRWLTVYPEINAFISTNAAQAGLDLDRVVEELESGVIPRRIAIGLASLGFFRSGLLTGRCIYVMARKWE